ncbi:Retrovirus-related Pol poly from transposon [Paramuricea clavata]|uniref:Retrovirus-related Pol poly from transposon n=1 Tax=Paramuricea clavata TaxID=317549 RepID=A0A6S7GEL9_PARCT|nr:Retrovirus-related Pol poly from transposon [Paramuricea clavata]
MSYFDKNKQTFVTVDASPVGISGILSQKPRNGDVDSQQIIAYASRALTDTEKRYSQTEKEALAIVWAVEHFHLFLFGSEFTLITDHKPLEIIYGQRTAKTSARIERWVLRLQPYTFKIIYKSGASNPADYLSRHPTNESKRKQEKMTEQYINFITQNSVPKAMTLPEIINATNADAALTALHDAIKTNKWDSPIVKPFKAVKNELTSTTHVAVDRYSRFPEVEIVHSTRASTVIPKLDKKFSVHGIPDTLISDNGPPFNGDDYARYLKALGIQAKFSTPYWPQGNATVERFMRPLGKALKTATLEGRPWKQELNRFLLQYRSTPHCTTGVPPSELLFNRVIKGKLPVINSKKIVNRHKEARDNEKTRQERNREYANQRRNTRKSDLQVGDYVLVRQEKKNKLTANFNHKPYEVIKKTGSEILAQSKDGHIVKRNVSHFKRINKPREEDTDDEGFDYEENSQNNQPDQAEFEDHRIDTDMNIHQI